ncbi:probable cardiolipin synthase (CMP-forming) [Prorops nasuta]|uniref:probable cardiolipin synthase (CMP-forming) n=1 Tax=Prorops nasuta TaxID=863751 RepID=UPI0034CE38BB
MSYVNMLHLTRNTILFNKCSFNTYIKECFVRHIRSSCTKNNKYKKINVNNKSRKTTLKTRILQDIKQTKMKVEEIIERENIWTLPNVLCIGRILSTPYLSYLIICDEYQVALWLLGIAGLSDLLDGWIARTWTSQASKLGSFLDPAADKLLVGSLYLSLTWVNLIPVPLTCLVLTRDIVLISAASYVRFRSLPPPKTLARYFDPTHATVQLAPTLTSKLNTGVQLLYAACSLAAPVFNFVDHPVFKGFGYFTALTTLVGGLSYIFSKNTYKLIRKNKISM